MAIKCAECDKGVENKKLFSCSACFIVVCAKHIFRAKHRKAPLLCRKCFNAAYFGR